jgi:D-3-phosphoglycerate dehydrogenase
MNDKKNTSYPKEKVNVLVLENISDTAVKLFKDAGYSSVRKLNGALSEEDLVNEIKDIHLLGIRSKTQVTQRVLDAAVKLQAVGCFCIGTNQVDLKTAPK